MLSANTRHGHSGFVPFLFPGFSLRWGLTICARIVMLYMFRNWIRYTAGMRRIVSGRNQVN